MNETTGIERSPCGRPSSGSNAMTSATDGSGRARQSASASDARQARITGAHGKNGGAPSPANDRNQLGELPRPPDELVRLARHLIVVALAHRPAGPTASSSGGARPPDRQLCADR
jgi:hypothetical protein